MEQTGATTSSTGMATPIELLCPLCDYDLRGLPEPRCPECGHQFEWEELTDPARMKLRWLFEHRRGLGGYLGTSLRLWRPWEFWGSWLRPSHRLVVGRVVGFGMVGVVLAVLVVAVGIVGTAVVGLQLQSLGARRLESMPAVGPELKLLQRSMPNSTQTFTKADANALSRQMTTQTYLDWRYPIWSTSPMPLWGSFWYWVRDDIERRLNDTWTWLAMVLALPLSGVLVLGVMRQSFSRAKIRLGHGVRVALYSADGGVFVVGYVGTCVLEMLNTVGWVNLPYHFLRTGLMPWLAILMWVVWIFRFEAGVRQYLCVPRPWLVTTATALIGALITLMLIANAYDGSW